MLGELEQKRQGGKEARRQKGKGGEKRRMKKKRGKVERMGQASMQGRMRAWDLCLRRRGRGDDRQGLETTDNK